MLEEAKPHTPVRRGSGLFLGVLFASLSVVLFVLNTRLGIGILPDSTRYMRFGPEGYDAPMYSWLLSAVGLLTSGIVTAARPVGLVLTALNALLIWSVMVRGAGARLGHAAVGTALILLSPHFVGLHAVAMSEPLYLAGLFTSVLLFLKHHETGDWRWLLACAVVLGLTMLVRFTTLPLIAALALCLLMDAARPIRRRFQDAVVLGGLSGGIFLAWAVAAKLATGHATGRAFAFHGNMTEERWRAGLDMLSAYLLPTMVPWQIRQALLFLSLTAVFLLWLGAVRQAYRSAAAGDRMGTALVPVIFGLFALIYAAFLVLSVSIEANLYLNGRYSLPLYVALVMTAVTALAGRGSRPPRPVWLVLTALAALFLTSHAVRTARLARELHANGKGYNSLTWRASPVVAALGKLPVDAVIYSNGPDALNYLTGRKTRFIPFLFQRRTGKDDPRRPFSMQMEETRRQLARGNGYVVFLDEVTWRFYLPSEDYLKQKLNLAMVRDLPDGRIYGVRRASAPDRRFAEVGATD